MENIKTNTQSYKNGEVIFVQGSSASCMYDIRWGRVGIFVDYGTKDEKQLTTLYADEFFGEMGLVDSCPRSATAVSLADDTKLEIITAESFDAYFQDKPAKVMMIMQSMSQRIRGLTRDYLEACRAIVEAEESQRSGKEKSGWFKAHLKKFVDDYNAGVKAMYEYDDDNGSISHPPIGRHW